MAAEVVVVEGVSLPAFILHSKLLQIQPHRVILHKYFMSLASQLPRSKV